MSTQTSKAALRELERNEFLVTSIRTEQPTVSLRVSQTVHEVLADGEGEPPPAPDWDLLQQHHIALLEASAAEVRRTDRVHRLNLVRDRRLRQDRREQVTVLRSGHNDLRQSFTGTYGEKALPFVGLDAAAEYTFLPLREQMVEVLDRMRDPDLAARLPAPRSGQSPIVLGPLADEREVEVDRLSETMKAINRMDKRLDGSLFAKRAAQARHRRIYSNVAKMQEGLYRLAGLDELADKIRVTVRSPRKKKEEEEEAPQEEAPKNDRPTESTEPTDSDAGAVGEEATV